MEYKLTTKFQHAKVLPNGKQRSLRLYFLNNVLLFTQKVPFDETSGYGVGKWSYSNEYLFNGRIHQTRSNRKYNYENNTVEIESRDVTYPVSKRKLKELEVPNDLKIEVTKR